MKGDLDAIGVLSGGFLWQQGGPTGSIPRTGSLFLGKEASRRSVRPAVPQTHRRKVESSPGCFPRGTRAGPPGLPVLWQQKQPPVRSAPAFSRRRARLFADSRRGRPPPAKYAKFIFSLRFRKSLRSRLPTLPRKHDQRENIPCSSKPLRVPEPEADVHRTGSTDFFDEAIIVALEKHLRASLRATNLRFEGSIALSGRDATRSA